MKTLPTFKEQFDKITEAYIKGEIKPYDASFCFCGTLCNNTRMWQISRNLAHNDWGGYVGNDFIRMENALLITIENEFPQAHWLDIPEDVLFEGMCAALEVLKEIHREKGENIEQQFEFKKRELVPA